MRSRRFPLHLTYRSHRAFSSRSPRLGSDGDDPHIPPPNGRRRCTGQHVQCVGIATGSPGATPIADDPCRTARSCVPMAASLPRCNLRAPSLLSRVAAMQYRSVTARPGTASMLPARGGKPDVSRSSVRPDRPTWRFPGSARILSARFGVHLGGSRGDRKPDRRTHRKDRGEPDRTRGMSRPRGARGRGGQAGCS